MTHQEPEYYEPEPVIGSGVIRLGVLFAILRRQRPFVIACVVVAVVAAIVFLHVAPKKYTTTMEITATQSPEKGSASSGLSALSSIAGIDLGTGDTQFHIFLDSLQSPVAAEVLAHRQDLLKDMFPRDWSESEKRWREPPSLVRPVVHGIESVLGFTVPAWSPPSTNRVQDYLQSELKVSEDQKSGVVTLEMDSEDPAVAAKILLALNSSVDELMRQRALLHTGSYIDYLTKKLSTVTVAEYREALLSNLAQQEKTHMMASAPVPFVAEVLGPPLVSAEPTSPAPITTFIVAVVLGTIFGSLWAIVADRRGWRFGLPARFEVGLPHALRSGTKHVSQ